MIRKKEMAQSERNGHSKKKKKKKKNNNNNYHSETYTEKTHRNIVC